MLGRNISIIELYDRLLVYIVLYKYVIGYFLNILIKLINILNMLFFKDFVNIKG